MDRSSKNIHLEVMTERALLEAEIKRHGKLANSLPFDHPQGIICRKKLTGLKRCLLKLEKLQDEIEAALAAEKEINDEV